MVAKRGVIPLEKIALLKKIRKLKKLSSTSYSSIKKISSLASPLSFLPLTDFDSCSEDNEKAVSSYERKKYGPFEDYNIFDEGPTQLMLLFLDWMCKCLY